ncbi:MAG: hypothetical protein COA96_13600 [SAR86 cluster bacterium]|uniref:Gluconate 2-dehydrogenase subunit 3 family protein n=1 Tax=SAR86 cluster bacterium TaxID=2030880 RepID=A0A2A5AU06_9GAMM|nr:MAG: hypothetical protein COA96_13600 [SAR86 cluster bacterium]
MPDKLKNNKKQLQNQPSNPSRRNLLKNVGLVGAAAVSSAATGNLIAADSGSVTIDTTANPIREALEVLTAEEAQILEAICDCLIPSDENGPGAKEARAVHYIDRALASHNSDARQDYMVSLNAINDFARETRHKPFYELIKDQQNSILLAVQNNKIPGLTPSASGFFNMVRSHTIDGTFCDPYYGGNQNFVGWDMVRYPGIRLGASETDVSQGAELEPNHQSAYDHATYTKMAINMNDSSTSGGSHA